jgi:hypothetical protein
LVACSCGLFGHVGGALVVVALFVEEDHLILLMLQQGFLVLELLFFHELLHGGESRGEVALAWDREKLGELL